MEDRCDEVLFPTVLAGLRGSGGPGGVLVLVAVHSISLRGAGSGGALVLFDEVGPPLAVLLIQFEEVLAVVVVESF